MFHVEQKNQAFHTEKPDFEYRVWGAKTPLPC